MNESVTLGSAFMSSAKFSSSLDQLFVLQPLCPRCSVLGFLMIPAAMRSWWYCSLSLEISPRCVVSLPFFVLTNSVGSVHSFFSTPFCPSRFGFRWASSWLLDWTPGSFGWWVGFQLPPLRHQWGWGRCALLWWASAFRLSVWRVVGFVPWDAASSNFAPWFSSERLILAHLRTCSFASYCSVVLITSVSLNCLGVSDGSRIGRLILFLRSSVPCV